MTDMESVKNAQRLHHILQSVQRIHRSVVTSLRVSTKAIPTASLGTRREVFFLCLIAERRNGQKE